MKKIKVIGQMDNADGTFESSNRVYDTEGIAPTIPTCGGGNLQPKILCRVVGGLGEMKSNNGTQFYQQDRVYSDGDVAPCITANLSGGSYKFLFAVRGREEGQEPEVREGGVSNTITTVQKDNMICEGSKNEMGIKYRIRKLTPRECWRLMDFTDEQFERAEAVNSNSQLYKQAGNSIVVSCLEAIFSQMGIGEKWNDREFKEGSNDD